MTKTPRRPTKIPKNRVAPRSSDTIAPVATWINADADQTYILWSLWDKHAAKRKKVLISRSDYSSPSRVTQILLNAGAVLPASFGEAKDVVTRKMSVLPTGVIIVTGKAGWHNDKHMHPGRMVRISPTVRVRFGDPCRHTPLKSGRNRIGSRKRYLRAMRPLAAKSDYLIFCLALGLAGPTLRFCRAPETAIFSLVGPSSSGKSTGLRAAAGASGSSATGQIPSFDFTARGLEERAGELFNDRLLVIDELTTMQGSQSRSDLEAIRRTILKLSGGQGRTISKHAEASNLAHQSWLVMVLTAMEETLRMKLRVYGTKGLQGTDVRLIEIPVPPEKDGGIFNLCHPSESKALVEQTEFILDNHFGHLELPFVEYLEADMPNAQSTYTKFWDAFLKENASRLEGPQFRIAKKFAHIYATGRLAIDADLAPYSAWALWRACKYTLFASLAAFDDDSKRQQKAASALLTAAGDGSGIAWADQLHGRALLFIEHVKCPSDMLSRDDLKMLTAAARSARALVAEPGRNTRKQSSPLGHRPWVHAFDIDWLKSVAHNRA